jgi:Arc/MetJ-type ribon-helix-helix transcriptional regulator
MRQVLSLSLPLKTTVEIKRLAKKRGFVSVSGYINHLVVLDQELISEKALWNSVKQARREYKTNKTVKAKSLADLV